MGCLREVERGGVGGHQRHRNLANLLLISGPQITFPHIFFMMHKIIHMNTAFSQQTKRFSPKLELMSFGWDAMRLKSKVGMSETPVTGPGIGSESSLS